MGSSSEHTHIDPESYCSRRSFAPLSKDSREIRLTPPVQYNRETPKSHSIGSDKGLSLSLVLARGTFLCFLCCAWYDERHFCSLSSHHGALNGC